jgi:hypothetical protein
VINTNGCDTGNIEFWDWDYQETNAAAIPGASNTTFDFGDRRGSSRGGSYGSMQVHNHGAGQTCLALSRFGNCGGSDSVCVGIGNNPSGYPDWTHSNSGANWDSRRLLVFVKPAPQSPAVPAEVLANVPDAAAFKHLYTIDIPVRARFDVDASNTLYYSVNNAAALSGAFGRVGYYLELVQGSVTSFCWTAFDTFTQDLAQLGVPRKDKIYQQFVHNLDVRSNVAGVPATNGCETGNIEFWDWDYTSTDNQGIPGGSNTAFDFADSRSGARRGRYGSMQVHNWGAGQTLWAINRFNSSSENVCIGIGNSPTGTPTGHSGSTATSMTRAACWSSSSLPVRRVPSRRTRRGPRRRVPSARLLWTAPWWSSTSRSPMRPRIRSTSAPTTVSRFSRPRCIRSTATPA